MQVAKPRFELAVQRGDVPMRENGGDADCVPSGGLVTENAVQFHIFQLSFDFFYSRALIRI
jgi:hypothetical protein